MLHLYSYMRRGNESWRWRSGTAGCLRMGSSPAASPLTPASWDPTPFNKPNRRPFNGRIFCSVFLLVKKICMLFTHISISIQTHTHTQIHMPTQRAVMWKRVVCGGAGVQGVQWETPWNFQYIKIEVRCVFSSLHSNVKCQRQINVTATPRRPPSLPFCFSFPTSTLSLMCVCVYFVTSFGAHFMRCHDA